MADDTDFEERPVRRAIGGSVVALAGGVVLLWSLFGVSLAEATEERDLDAVTFVVGGMMKSRSGAT